jgi:hypothetical protein
METTTSDSCTARIGCTAGTVWKTLSDNGPMTMAKLVKTVNEPRDLVMQAVGWLAREGKLNMEQKQRSCIVTLCENTP